MSNPELQNFMATPDIIDVPGLNPGGKACGLEMLQKLGMNVPSFFIIPSTTENIDDILNSQHLNEKTLWAVRSSANVEDGHLASYAGQFKTVLAVKTHELSKAVAEVHLSVERNKALTLYSTRNNMPLDSIEMNVVIQEFIEPEFAGVWIGAGNGNGILEWVEGRGSNLVDGTKTPNSISYPVSDSSDDNSQNPINTGGQSVGEICLEIENQLGYACDIEFCIKNGIIYWLQLRPATVDMSPYLERKEGLAEDILSGHIASKGIARALGLRYDLHPDEWQPDAILVARKTGPEDMHAIMTAAGIITEEGGKLSHAAVVSREFGIPCMIGVDTEKIPHKSYVELDAEAGTVIVDTSKGNL